MTGDGDDDAGRSADVAADDADPIGDDADPTGDAAAPSRVFEATVRDGVLRLARPATRWLSTGHAGGESVAPAAYNVSVPEGWDDRDVDGYVGRRLDAAGFDDAGPTLLTGVSMRHARRARLGPVEAVVTAGVSNPAALPVDGSPRAASPTRAASRPGGDRDSSGDGDADAPAGTVNVVVGTTRALDAGALANLVAVAAEAKAATLLARTGFPGTTTDAVVAACDPAGESTPYSGSATEVGAAARACVRDALCASLDSRYGDDGDGDVGDGDGGDGDAGGDSGDDAVGDDVGSEGDRDAIPASVADAAHGVVTDARAVVSVLTGENDGERL